MLNKNFEAMIVTFKHCPTGLVHGFSAVKGSSIDKLKNYVRKNFRLYEMYTVNDGSVFRVLIHSKDCNKFAFLVLWFQSNCEYIDYSKPLL